MSNTFEREYKKEIHVITPVDGQFEHKGTVYNSLTAIAQAITGQKAISGPRFFGVSDAPKAPKANKADKATGKKVDKKMKDLGVLLGKLIDRVKAVENADLRVKIGHGIVKRLNTELGLTASEESEETDSEETEEEDEQEAA